MLEKSTPKSVPCIKEALDVHLQTVWFIGADSKGSLSPISKAAMERERENDRSGTLVLDDGEEVCF